MSPATLAKRRTLAELRLCKGAARPLAVIKTWRYGRYSTQWYVQDPGAHGPYWTFKEAREALWRIRFPMLSALAELSE